jgi:hypothetical protein
MLQFLKIVYFPNYYYKRVFHKWKHRSMKKKDLSDADASANTVSAGKSPDPTAQPGWLVNLMNHLPYHFENVRSGKWFGHGLDIVEAPCDVQITLFGNGPTTGNSHNWNIWINFL